jgi:hypothetical protein
MCLSYEVSKTHFISCSKKQLDLTGLHVELQEIICQCYEGNSSYIIIQTCVSISRNLLALKIAERTIHYKYISVSKTEGSRIFLFLTE